MMVGESYHNANMYYATRFLAPDNFTYLCADGNEYIIVSQMEFERAKKESSISKVISLEDYGYKERLMATRNADTAYNDTIAAMLSDLKIKKILVPKDFPLYMADTLRLRGFEVSIGQDKFEKMREVKTSGEIEKIKYAQAVNEKGMAKAIEIIRRSSIKGDSLVYNGETLTSEYLQRAIEMEFIRNGCDANDTIVASGPRSADPHYAGEGAIKPDQLIVIDIFPYSKKERYFADMTRTVVKGTPTQKMQEMYDVVLEAQKIALSAIKAGVTGKSVNDLVCDCFEKYGYGTTRTKSKTGFIHSTGHGVGIEIHEKPSIGESGVEPLVPGNVVTVEPGLYEPGTGGVRIEDMVVVREKGNENLTKFPKFLKV